MHPQDPAPADHTDRLTATAAQPEAAQAAANTERPAAFRFPFSAKTYAPRAEQQPGYPRPHGCDHTRHPGAAPRGTRRSMGKR